jgi:hypothetical protein
MIAARTGTTPDDQRLIFRGRHLGSVAALEDCGLQQGSELELVLTLKGGSKPQETGKGPQSPQSGERRSHARARAAEQLPPPAVITRPELEACCGGAGTFRAPVLNFLPELLGLSCG